MNTIEGTSSSAPAKRTGITVASLVALAGNVVALLGFLSVPWTACQPYCADQNPYPNGLGVILGTAEYHATSCLIGFLPAILVTALVSLVAVAFRPKPDGWLVTAGIGGLLLTLFVSCSFFSFVLFQAAEFYSRAGQKPGTGSYVVVIGLLLMLGGALAMLIATISARPKKKQVDAPTVPQGV